MDVNLQQLKRQAATTGDYSQYEAALARVGQKRIVLRRLTVACFSLRWGASRALADLTNTLKGYEIQVTHWSATSFFQLGAKGSPFTVDLDQLKPGYTVWGGWDRNERIRVLDIEIRELIVPVEYLKNHPITATKERLYDSKPATVVVLDDRFHNLNEWDS